MNSTHQTSNKHGSQPFFQGHNLPTKRMPKILQNLVLTGLLFSNLLIGLSTAQAAPEDVGVNYDIVYVRYPATDPRDNFVSIPQGEHAYDIAAGADLMLLRPNGSEITLVNCNTCSVMDPFISFDGRYVYYSLIEEGTLESASWLYKINLSAGAPYTPIRLTFDDGFESANYTGNSTSSHDQASQRGIRDMAPAPLADGRIVFTSNRSALTAFDPGTNATITGSIQQLYVMDDHDGSAVTAAESNLHRLETGTLHMAQHPFQLKDGRIMFSTWQDVGNKFLYAMTPLFTVHPDGSNMQQFTEPHDHHKNVEHFATQLADEQIVSGWYYPSFDYGFGALLRYPISDPSGIDYMRQSIDETQPFGNKYLISFREFDRKGTTNLTPHTTPSDVPAPNLSGKYSMPSTTVNGDLLVAYSTGSVNWFDSACASLNACEALKSGIYIIRSAENTPVSNPNQLALVKNDPNYNEIWPRAVVPYQSIHNQAKPDIIASLADQTNDPRLEDGEAAAITGTSSMYNMDPSDRNDLFQTPAGREFHDGNWTIQGAEAGIFTNNDIHAVRIITTPPKPFTKPITRWGDDAARWTQISRYLDDPRLDGVVARYGSLHNESWEILGEFPLTHKATNDLQGNPDSSWMAKIPAETPFLIQTLDKNGMTIVSELVWRALKSGENRSDCGGCHAHSVPALEFSTTQAGKSAPIIGVAGVPNSDERISGGMWDLTTGSIPTLSSTGVSFINQRSLSVEFNRDILPIINNRCTSCHTAGASNGGLILDGAAPNDAWGVLTNNDDGTWDGYSLPQRSKYIRIPQARESLLVWAAYGERLDGRTNSSRPDDVDYPTNHPALSLTDLEKRSIARWVDLGSPINFPTTDGFGYTDDNQLPVINVFRPKRGYNATPVNWKIGVTDAKSGIDLSTFRATYTPISEQGALGTPVNISIDTSDFSATGVITIPKLNRLKYLLEISVRDLAGNISIDQRYVHNEALLSPVTDMRVE